MAVHKQFFRSLLNKIEQLTQDLQFSQKASSVVNSEYVTGSKPSSWFIFITANPVVRLNILASGYF